MENQIQLSEKLGQYYDKMLDGKILENLYNQQNEEQKLQMIFNFLKAVGDQRSNLMISMLYGHFNLKIEDFHSIFINENKRQLIDIMLKNLKLNIQLYKQKIFQQENPVEEFTIFLTGLCISLQKVDKAYLKKINKKSKAEDEQLCEQIFDDNQKTFFSNKIKTYLVFNDIVLRYRLNNFNLNEFLNELLDNPKAFEDHLQIFKILQTYSDCIYVRNIKQYEILGSLQLTKNSDKFYDHTAVCITECKFTQLTQIQFNRSINDSFLTSYKQQLTYLNQSYLFKLISPEIQLQLAMLSKQMNMHKNQLIYKEDEQNEYIYFIMNGEIHLQAKIKENNDKKSNILQNLHINKNDKKEVFKNVAVLGKGQVFGDEILISDYSNKVNQAKCNTDTFVLILTKKQIQSYINSPEQLLQIEKILGQKHELRTKKLMDTRKLQKVQKNIRVAQSVTFDVNNAWEQNQDNSIQVIQKKEKQYKLSFNSGPKLPLIQNSFYKKYTDNSVEKNECQQIINTQKIQYNKLKGLIQREDVEIQEADLNKCLKLKVKTSHLNEDSLDIEARHLTARYQGCFFKSISEIGRASFYLKNQLNRDIMMCNNSNEFIMSVNKQIQSESDQMMSMKENTKNKSQNVKNKNNIIQLARQSNKILLYKQKLKRNQSILNNQEMQNHWNSMQSQQNQSHQ